MVEVDFDFDIKELEEEFMSEWFKRYRKVFPNAEPIPMMELMGNSILVEKFYGNPDAVYDYCIENHKTWEDVLGYKYDPDVIY